jgi:hypothetical protein
MQRRIVELGKQFGLDLGLSNVDELLEAHSEELDTQDLRGIACGRGEKKKL